MDGRESNTLVLVGESGVKDLLDACGVTKFACRTSNDYQVLVFLFLFCFLSEKKKIFCFSLVLCDPITFQLLLTYFHSKILTLGNIFKYSCKYYGKKKNKNRVT